MLVNGKPIEEFLRENEKALDKSDDSYYEDIRRYRSRERGDAKKSPQSSGGLWRGDVPRRAKHKPPRFA